MRQPRRMECVEKRSCRGPGQVWCPHIASMIVGCSLSHRPMSTHLSSMLTSIKKPAHHAEGVQYEIKSFADGAYGGACSVIIPNRSTKTCRARSEVKIFPRSWKIIAGLPKQGQECSHPE